jgi:hypothetical protein
MGVLGYRVLKACLEIPGNAFWIWKALPHSSVGRGNALTAEEWALKQVLEMGMGIWNESSPRN